MRTRLRLAFTTWCLVLGCFFSSRAALAHPLDSSTLSLTEISDGKFLVHWQTSSPTLLREIGQPAVYPAHCRLGDREVDCGAAGLTGTITLPWLSGSQTRVMVKIAWRKGPTQIRVLDGRDPTLAVYGTPPAAGLRYLWPIALDYTRLGIIHILTGYDHLLFVLAVTLLVRGRRKLLAAITAFTVAHSLTLAATVFGWLAVPAAPVETVIALSIVLACAECLRPENSLTRRIPWLMTFSFGLLHGFGFASSLIAIGLPQQHVASALLFFNVGVELGQLGAIASFLAVGWLVHRSHRRPAWLSRGLVYAMGTMAAYWSIERGLGMFVR